MTNLVLCELQRPADIESHSPYCLKVHRSLRALGLPYTSRHGRPDSYKALNPLSQVPVLLIDGEPVSDSTRILKRVMELRPGKLHQSGEAWLWEELGDTALNGFLIAARWADDRNWPGVKEAFFGEMPSLIKAVVPSQFRRKIRRDLVGRDVTRAGMEACWLRFCDLLDKLEERAPIEGFWLGSALSVADLGLFPQLQSLRLPLTAWQQAEIAQRRRLCAWLDRVNVMTSAPPQAGGLTA